MHPDNGTRSFPVVQCPEDIIEGSKCDGGGQLYLSEALLIYAPEADH